MNGTQEEAVAANVELDNYRAMYIYIICVRGEVEGRCKIQLDLRKMVLESYGKYFVIVNKFQIE